MHGKGEAPAIRILEEAGEDVGRLEYRFVEQVLRTLIHGSGLTLAIRN